MVVEESLAPGQTRQIASGQYRWSADGAEIPISESWRILRARTGYALEAEADASAVPEFGYVYTSTLSLDDDRRPTGLSMRVTHGENTVRVSAHFEPDAAVITRVLISAAAGAIQRTQTFRMPLGYTVEAHPVLFDGLHIAALNREAAEPYRRPCLWFDITAREPGSMMAAYPVSYAIGTFPGPLRNRYSLTRWGYDLHGANTLITVREMEGWFVPSELRFSLVGTVYSVRLSAFSSENGAA